MILRSGQLSTGTLSPRSLAPLRGAIAWFWRFSTFYGQYITTPLQSRHRLARRERPGR